MDNYIILTESKNMMKIKIKYINIKFNCNYINYDNINKWGSKKIWVEKTLSAYLCKEIIARKSNLWRNTNEMVK